jgi:hypothetical protein
MKYSPILGLMELRIIQDGLEVRMISSLSCEELGH